MLGDNSEVEQEQVCIWILGLMHSGTTIFWRAWREDGRFLCFDEPISGPEVFLNQDSRGTRAELVQVFEQDPKLFWKICQPLHPLEELDSEFTSGQRAYLSYLLDQAARVVIKETHLHLHLPALAKLTPHAYVVHLYRRASAFATSHLRPTWSRDATWLRRCIRRLRHEHNKMVFWDRPDFLYGLRRDIVIGNHPQSKFGFLLRDAGYDVKRIMSSPALIRILAYWHYHYHYLEREGPHLFGNRYVSIRYEDFANAPRATMVRSYRRLGITVPEQVSIPDVHAPKPPHKAGDPRWRSAAQVAGFSDSEIEDLL